MPQLIAMVIVVVGAMIYMFQTFGGTGDKIESVAQKSSIITEINNIKDGLRVAARSEQLATADKDDMVGNLQGLGKLTYFADQINEQVVSNDNNTYYAISFGGSTDDKNNGAKPAMVIKPVLVADKIPGIFIDLSQGSLKDNASFLETQLANDLKGIANIDRGATTAAQGTTATNKWQTTENKTDERTPRPTAANGAGTTVTNTDGKMIIYFKDFGSNEVVKNGS